ncbi:hypothetical protein [Helicobacter rodentium]|uniref:hypothetical protein n=1 Tax=Helicobacter rodentium TaxID=59617 RepID=UPI00047E86D9|nr:hypothetical protein [Helicobacter rodentium]
MIQINHFIQVKGGADIGKTTTITRCFLELLENAKIKDFRYIEGGDFVAVVEYKGNILAFVSAGDIERETKNCYEILCEMFQSEIKVCIFATRTKGYGVEYWQKIATQNGKKNFDESLENQWFNICNENGEQDGKKKKEITTHLQEQTKILVNLIEQYLQGGEQ